MRKNGGIFKNKVEEDIEMKILQASEGPFHTSGGRRDIGRERSFPGK